MLGMKVTLTEKGKRKVADEWRAKVEARQFPEDTIRIAVVVNGQAVALEQGKDWHRALVFCWN